MKLFENGVGRPSNEIKKKRKIFIASIIVLCIALVSVIAFTLTKVSTNRLKGAAKGAADINDSYIVDIKDISCDYNNDKDELMCRYNWSLHRETVYIKVDSIITKVGDTTYKNGYTGTENKNYNPKSAVYAISDFLTLPIDDDVCKDKNIEITLHAEVRTYESDVLLYKFDYVHNVKMDGNSVSSAPNGTKKNIRIENESILFDKAGSSNKPTPTTTTKLTISCPESKNVKDKITCTANQSDVSFTIYGVKAFASGYKAKVKGKSASIKYDSAKLFNGSYEIEIDKNKKEYVNAKIVAKKGSQTVTKYVKVYSGDKLTISCPKTVQAEEPFICETKIAKSTISGPKTNLAENYKVKSENVSSKKFKYTKPGKVTISVEKKGKSVKTTVKTTVNVVEKIPVNDLKYVVPKVFKVDANGTKTIEINPYRLGFDVKYYQFVVCKDRDACLNYTTPNENAKASGLISIDKIKENVKIKFSSNNKALLGSDFYIRAITYDNYGKEIYYKVNRFFVNSVTNKKVSNEANVKNDDYADTTNDFIYSSNLTVDLKDHEHFYEISSIEKIKTSTADKMVNINLENSGKNVKYVRFVVCPSYSDCKKDDIFDLIASDSKIGTASELLEAKPGQGVSLSLFTGDDDLLKTSIYSVVFTYDENKNLLFKKIHKFTTSSKTKLGVEKEASIRVGDRVSTKHKRLSSKIYSQEN